MKYLSFFALLILCLASNYTLTVQAQSKCTSINNKLIVNGSLMFFGKKCTLYPILDPQVYNQLVTKQKFTPYEITDETYAQLGVGKTYTLTDYMNDFFKNTSSRLHKICNQYNNSIVSVDNLNFYYIEDCKKRKFSSFVDVETFRESSNTAILSISNYELNLLMRGRSMWVAPRTSKPEKTNIEIIQNLPSTAQACQQVKEKAHSPIVAYYASSFYFQNCTLYPILNLTIELMKQADDAGGLYELSTDEYLAIPQGSQWNNKN